MTQTSAARLLVIDDDKDLCDLIGVRLSGLFEVLSAQDGERGIMLAQASHPDVFLIDLFLPRISGLSVLRYLRHQARFHALPVFLMTAYLENLVDPKSAYEQCLEVFTKPFDLGLLEERLNPYARPTKRGGGALAPPPPAAGAAQRRAPRMTSKIPARLAQQCGEQSCLIRTLSPGGALLQTDVAVAREPGTLAFAIEDVPLSFTADVLYQNEQEGLHLTGLRFRSITLDDEFRLWRYVETHHAQAERQRLAKALVALFEREGLKVLQAAVDGMAAPRRIRKYAPDVFAFDEARELVHLGACLPGFALSEPRSRGVIAELAEQQMADGASRGKPMPLVLAVPAGWAAVARRTVNSLELSIPARDVLRVHEVS